jgi:glycosyltransferase involved in cell wall biosynthesis
MVFEPRPPRILWANMFCLLDTSSGASISAREMLRQLALKGYEVAIVGATIFDHPHGNVRMRKQWDFVQSKKGQFINVNDGPLVHRLLVTESTRRSNATCNEENIWHSYYIAVLDTFKPDLMFFYGGRTIDMLKAVEARARGIPTAAYLVNAAYRGPHWCRDVDLMITDSNATAQNYRDKEGYRIIPVGAFIDPAPVVARQHSRENLLLVNPTAEKGANIVILLALDLEQRRPDIKFEVVQSRGNWDTLVKQVTTAIGRPRDSLSNVILTQHTDDMRPIYGRARLLLAPSLWWDSGPRVLAEAMLNGIPAIITKRGGMPEMIGDAGIHLNFAANLYEPPHMIIPNPSHLSPVADLIIRMYDDEAYYQGYVARARNVGRTLHNIDTSTQRLVDAFKPLLDQKAGDQDFAALLKAAHKQGLAPAG